ncbi:MAG TPA: hypothetical protein VL651_02655, partial [Bacteroidia bacterium]|nr:hypothetical protein [Bacteroidia bacterium]
MKEFKLIFLFLIPIISNAQVMFEKSYGGLPQYDWTRYMVETYDGGYALAGHTANYTAGQSDCYLIRTDANGDTLWTSSIGGPLGEEYNFVEELSDHGFIGCGYSNGFGNGSWD